MALEHLQSNVPARPFTRAGGYECGWQLEGLEALERQRQSKLRHRDRVSRKRPIPSDLSISRLDLAWKP
jgi:hypothetical protein